MKKIFYSAFILVMAAFTLASCEDVPMPYAMPTENDTTVVNVEPKGTGTATDPYNIAGVQEFAKTLDAGASSTNVVYFRGKVVSIKEITDATGYGNATFYLSDDGTTTNQFYVYRSYGLDNKKVTSVDLIKEGDDVIVCGTVTNYNGTFETAQNKAYIVSVNGTGGNQGGGGTVGVKGTGTATDPFNVAGVTAEAQKLSTGQSSANQVYFKGKVVSITEITDATGYGNATFYLSDDGTTTGKFYVYRALGLNNQKITSTDLIKVGDDVVVCGTLTNYNGTIETAANGAYIVSVNSNGGGDNGGGNTGTSDGVSMDGSTVTLTNSAVTAGTETLNIVVNDLGIADKAVVTNTYTLNDGTKLTIGQGDGKTAPTYYTATNGFRIYADNTITFECKKPIAKIVMQCDVYNGVNQVGNTTATVAFSGNTATYVNFFSTNSGGVQLRPQKFTITFAQ